MSSGQNTFVSDAPISDPTHDRFNRLWFAKRIAQTISARWDPSSIVIAINGAWGDGKTTVMNFIGRELRSLPDIVVVSINPWRFATERLLLRYFFTSLAQALESSLSPGSESATKMVTQYGELIQIFCSGAGEVPGIRSEGLGAGNIEERKRAITEILTRAQKKVVILIDDIDRLDESAMQAVFRLAKLTADFENSVYVLAFDAEMVATVLGERFTASVGRRTQAGHDFLEKIVQVPLDLPAVPASALLGFTFEAVAEALNVARITMSDPDASRFKRLFHEGLEIRLTTPRMAKRFGNALAFTLAINGDEVNAAEMMLVEGIRVFYPNAYAAIRRNKDILSSSGIVDGVDLDRDERVQRFFLTATKGLTTAETSALRRLLAALFPRVQGRVRYDPDEEAEWAKARRVTSAAYFDRYFSYTLPSTERQGRAPGIVTAPTELER